MKCSRKLNERIIETIPPLPEQQRQPPQTVFKSLRWYTLNNHILRPIYWPSSS